MGASSWAIPVGILAAIVVVGFAFFWWWFPRTWRGGVKQDDSKLDDMSPEDREQRRRKNREIIERFTHARAAERGEVVGSVGGGAVGREMEDKGVQLVTDARG